MPPLPSHFVSIAREAFWGALRMTSAREELNARMASGLSNSLQRERWVRLTSASSLNPPTNISEMTTPGGDEVHARVGEIVSHSGSAEHGTPIETELSKHARAFNPGDFQRLRRQRRSRPPGPPRLSKGLAAENVSP
jgi:hypothetical protein